ncbi:hypothetical protein EOA22_10400 [Mesorhizobium sp. M7A.F.Ca.US.014.04.1.1]|uniref:hypothetical protein n=2 Tax=Phyllobacteriaceae TaxID=69277 RepID=UPI000A4F0AF5|nr:MULTISPECIES: hypothetical protein [Mesorhizobium]MDF3207154.1 hypothetical protein [Mesorhizobium sp. LMG15046]MDF3230721.1 hypothetical protein [Mesorhizobium sp. DSM 30133]RUU21004.1 hypothetical protein EOC84_09395 [Mesorhizobium sp. Primo-B]RUU39663.1 hypothetical protein EOC83_08970 [Mesorhizobium sp. Primo-A]RUX17554.1 hypothetical protein EN996_04595 [Mesorhizobium sp. M7A.F.Ca.CA.002.14.1.2]
MTLEEAIAEHMQLIDLELQVEELPLWQRPLRASIKFVLESILDIRGDTKEDFAGKPWFAVIFHHIETWYRDTYGSAFDQSSGEGFASGVVLVRHVPIEIRVPLTRTTPGTPGETVWLHFPLGIEQGETPTDWLVNPPNLAKIDLTESRKLKTRTTAVATALRRIRMNTMGVTAPDHEITELIDGVLSDLQNAAIGLLTDSDTARGAAMWSMQMAIERTIKAFILQKTGRKYRETHDLFYLYDDALPHCSGINRGLLKKLPNSREMMEGRYGLGTKWTIRYATEAYFAALMLISEFSARYDRKISVGGSRVHLKRPPWLTLPKPVTT